MYTIALAITSTSIACHRNSCRKPVIADLPSLHLTPPRLCTLVIAEKPSYICTGQLGQLPRETVVKESILPY